MQNIFWPNDTASLPWLLESPTVLLWETQISHNFTASFPKLCRLFSFLLQVQLTEEELQEIISETRTELRQVNDCYHLVKKKHKTVVTKGQKVRVMYIWRSFRDVLCVTCLVSSKKMRVDRILLLAWFETHICTWLVPFWCLENLTINHFDIFPKRCNITQFI